MYVKATEGLVQQHLPKSSSSVLKSSFYQSFRLFESEALRNQYLLAVANRYREFSNFAKKNIIQL